MKSTAILSVGLDFFDDWCESGEDLSKKFNVWLDNLTYTHPRARVHVMINHENLPLAVRKLKIPPTDLLLNFDWHSDLFNLDDYKENPNLECGNWLNFMWNKKTRSQVEYTWYHPTREEKEGGLGGRCDTSSCLFPEISTDYKWLNEVPDCQYDHFFDLEFEDLDVHEIFLCWSPDFISGVHKTCSLWYWLFHKTFGFKTLTSKEKRRLFDDEYNCYNY